MPDAAVSTPGRQFSRFVAEVRAEPTSDTGEPRATFVISTGDQARDGHVIAVDGWQLKNYRKNPVVMWCHDYSQPPIGTCESIGVRDGELQATVRFCSEQDHPFGYQIGRMVQAGHLRAASVGWDPIEYIYDEKLGGYRFAKQELLEWSIVPVPADAGALVKRAAEAKIDLRPFVAELARALDPPPSLAQLDLAAEFHRGLRDADARAAARWLTNIFRR